MFEKGWDILISLVQHLEVGWSTGWWFTAAFGLVNLILIIRYGKAFAKHLFAFPKFQSLTERIISLASVFLFARALMVYTVFVPIKEYGVRFYGGIIVFIIGLGVHTYAMINFATTSPDKPVVKGSYQYSRHPMQIMGIVMWFGVGMATGSWIIILACVIQVFLCRSFLIAQERSCLESYEEEYREYMTKVPRYFIMH
jgi:protein-S-isoprenylcysteine O-methyltransferase Ste14